MTALSVDINLQMKPLVTMKVTGMLLILSLMYNQDMGEILRLSCETYANFSISEENKRIDDSFRTIVETEKASCQYECAREPRCKSINFNDREQLCELSEKSADDPKDSIRTNTDNGWDYFSPSYNETLV